jgi:HEAT repeat protein
MVPLLLPLLEGKDRRAKLWAMRALEDIGGSKAVAALRDVWVKDIDGTDELASDVARRSLLRHPDRRVLPRCVRDAVRDKELYLAWEAVYALGKLGDEEALPRLRQAAEDHRELVRMQAAAQLAHRGQADGELSVLTGLTSETEIVRLIARWGLPKLPDHKKVQEHLIALLKVKADEEKLPERARDRLRRVRLDLLGDIYAWDRARQEPPPLVYAIRDLLEQPAYAGAAARILRKLGYQVAWRDGRYKVVGEPR